MRGMDPAVEPVVFLVDEDPAAIETIRRLASMMNLPCEVFASGQEFLDTFDRSQAGCLISELKVPGVSGLRIIERLTEEGSTLPVVFVTAHATLPIAVRAMRAGAFHFLEKPCREQDLWDIIQDAIAIDRERRRASQRHTAIHDQLASLTRKEEEVLWRIGEGKSNRVIAEELNLSIRTVEVRRSTLARKLGLPNADGLVRFAISLGNGYSEPTPPFQHRCPLRKSLPFHPPLRVMQASG